MKTQLHILSQQWMCILHYELAVRKHAIKLSKEIHKIGLSSKLQQGALQPFFIPVVF